MGSERPTRDRRVCQDCGMRLVHADNPTACDYCRRERGMVRLVVAAAAGILLGVLTALELARRHVRRWSDG